MPSDPRTSSALAATAALRERFRSAVAAAAEQIESYLAEHAPRDGDAPAAAIAELGAFASGRIDAARFAALFDDARTLGIEPTLALRHAAATLRTLYAAGDAPFVVDVPPGGDLRDAVRRALSELGRAFGAVLTFQAVRTGVHRTDVHTSHRDGLPFARWNAAERELAPPLVVVIDDVDLRAESIVELVDGQTKIVFVVRGDAPGAPLVRLITPDVLVMQTSRVEDLERVASFDGPAVAALVPDDAARFVHDPDAGEALAERLAVHALPAAVPRTRSGGRSAWQLREEIAQLVVLNELGTRDSGLGSEAGRFAPASDCLTRHTTGEHREQSTPSPESRVPSPDHDVDALTNWLLAESGL